MVGCLSSLKTVKRSLFLNRTGQFKRYQHFRILHNEKEQYSTEQLTFNAGDFDGFMCGCDATLSLYRKEHNNKI
jgi:hypothetical protein